MLYSKQDSQNSKCDLYGKILSVLIALHIIISLTVIGVKYFNNKNETKKPYKIEDVKKMKCLVGVYKGSKAVQITKSLRG